MEYSYFHHRHNFAVWCAARAAQRGFTNMEVLKESLEKSGVVEFIEQNWNKSISSQEFDELHVKWCESMIQTFKRKGVAKGSYGRAAKLIAVYIKSMVVVRDSNCVLSQIAHPPIDSIILKNISRDKELKHSNQKLWGKIKWTKLNKAEYFDLIQDFREVLHGEPFWYLERYWTITQN